MIINRLAAAAALWLLAGNLCGPAAATDYRAGPLRIEQPWAVATPKGAKVGAGYLKITNDGTRSDRLIAIVTPVARKTAIHDMVKEGDVVKMRQMDNGIEIKPGETIALVPGGRHVMFEQLGAGLVAGERVKTMLTFETAGSLDVDFIIQPLGSRTPPGPAQSR